METVGSVAAGGTTGSGSTLLSTAGTGGAALDGGSEVPSGGNASAGGASAEDAGGEPTALDAAAPAFADASPPIDAALPALDDLGPFAAPSEITETTAPSSVTDDPSITDDRLLLFFNSTRSGGPGNGDIWFTERASVVDAWQAPQLSSVSSASRETTPGISRDGLSLWFSSDRTGPGACASGGGLDVWMSERPSRQDPFSAPVCVDELSGPEDDVSPALSLDGLSLVLTVDDGGFSQLHMATRTNTSEPFSPPAPIVELGGPHTDGDGVLARQGRELFFATERNNPGFPSLARSVRSNLSESFGAPVYLDELNGTGSDSDPWVTSDARYIVWTSNRSGSSRLYEASR